MTEFEKLLDHFEKKIKYELNTKGCINIYLGHPISDRANFLYSIQVAERLRAIDGRINVYAAAENDSINDKSNDPTPADIYDGDITELMASDIAVFNLPGGNQTGTITEVGMCAGHNSAVEKYGLGKRQYIHMIGFSSNARLAQPQFYTSPFGSDIAFQNASAGENHLTLGVFDKQGFWCPDEEFVYTFIRDVVKRAC